MCGTSREISGPAIEGRMEQRTRLQVKKVKMIVQEIPLDNAKPAF